MSDSLSHPEIPLETQTILQPVQLTNESSFSFRCHPEISCFNVCCSNIEILLTPYDILRLRKQLKLGADDFLLRYTEPKMLEKGELPVVQLAMDEKTGACPFVSPEGCVVYDDRPSNCRYYPLGMALMHKEKTTSNENETFFFLVKEPYCKGHETSESWIVSDWRQDQGLDLYDAMNRAWIEIILKCRSMGDATALSSKAKELFFMISTNLDAFRRFVFESSFLKRYTVNEGRIQKMREDDVALLQFGFDWLQSVLFHGGVTRYEKQSVATTHD